jgi:hypothetical protein
MAKMRAGRQSSAAIRKLNTPATAPSATHGFLGTSDPMLLEDLSVRSGRSYARFKGQDVSAGRHPPSAMDDSSVRSGVSAIRALKRQSSGADSLAGRQPQSPRPSVPQQVAEMMTSMTGRWRACPHSAMCPCLVFPVPVFVYPGGKHHGASKPAEWFTIRPEHSTTLPQFSQSTFSPQARPRPKP